MKINIKSVFVVGLIYCSVATSLFCQNIADRDAIIASEMNLELFVKIGKTSGGLYELIFGFKNKGVTSVRLDNSDLPWKWRHSLIMVLVTVPGGKVLEEVPIINDPSFGPKLLNPNSEIGGRLNLCYYYPDLPQVLRDSDVILFWSYPLISETNPSPRQGGWILIKREEQKSSYLNS